MDHPGEGGLHYHESGHPVDYQRRRIQELPRMDSAVRGRSTCAVRQWTLKDYRATRLEVILMSDPETKFVMSTPELVC